MNTRPEDIAFENLASSVYKKSNPEITANLDALELVLPDNQQEKIKINYSNIYKKMDLPLPNKSPFIIDRVDEKKGDTLLIHAAREKQYDTVDKLLQKGASTHIKNNDEETAFDQAIKNNDIKLGELLLKHGAATIVNRDLFYQYLPKAGEKQKDWINLWKKSKLSLLSAKHDAMYYAIEQHDFALVQLLRSEGLVFQPTQVLNNFINLNNEIQQKWVEFFIAIGADLNTVSNYNSTALIYCTRANNMPAMKKLLKAGARIDIANNENKSAMDYACEINSVELAELLFSHGAKLDAPKVVDLLHDASIPICKRWINLLIESKADLNVKGPKYQLPAILWMVAKNDVESVVTLIEHNVSVNCSDLAGNPTIHFAIENNNTSMAKILIAHGATLPADDVMAFLYKNIKAATNLPWINLLIDTKSNLEVRDKKYRDTPLIYSAFKNDADTVLRLLDAKVDINAKNTEKEDALSCAIEKENIKMIDALLSYGAYFYPFESRIVEISMKLIDSRDASDAYAAFSCLSQLYRITNNIKYKKKESSIETTLLGMLQPHIIPDLAKIVGEHLFFKSPKPVLTNEMESVPLPSKKF